MRPKQVMHIPRLRVGLGTTHKICGTDDSVEFGNTKSTLPSPQPVEHDVTLAHNEILRKIRPQAIEIVVATIARDDTLIDKYRQGSCFRSTGLLRAVHNTTERTYVPCRWWRQRKRRCGTHSAISASSL